MANITYEARLTQKDIKSLAQKLRQYQNRLKNKTNELVKELSDVGIQVIEENMENAHYTYDSKGVRSGSDTSHMTYVKMHSYGEYSQAELILQGKEVLFIEFGAGVYYNGAAGATPHPKGQEFGFTIGSYGSGNGQKKVWGYYNESGDLVLTRGVEATMPMYKAEQEIVDKYIAIAKKVFG